MGPEAIFSMIFVGWIVKMMVDQKRQGLLFKSDLRDPWADDDQDDDDGYEEQPQRRPRGPRYHQGSDDNVYYRG